MKWFILLILLLCSDVLLTPIQLAQRFEDVNQPVAEINIGVQITSLAMNVKRVAAISTVSGLQLYNAELLMLTEFRTDKVIRGVAWNPAGTSLALTVDSSVEIWNWDESTNTVTLERTLPASGSLLNVTWSPDGERIAAMTVADPSYDDNQLSTIDVWNTTSWTRFSYSDQYLVFALKDQPQVLNWNPNNPSQLIGVGFRARFEGGRVFYATNKLVFITDRDTGTVIKDIEIGNNAILASAWSQSGNTLAASSEVGSVQLYDATTGENTALYGIESQVIRAIDWSPFNGMIAAGNVVVDPNTNTRLGRYDVNSLVVGVAWLEDEDEFQGLLMMAERAGRITIQTIDVLPDYTSPTPENWELTETVTPQPIILTPTANAGADQAVIAYKINNFNTLVKLDGSASTSPNGAIVAYEWQRNNRKFADTVNPTVSLGFGTHTITLIVTDETGQQGVDYVSIDVTPVTVTPSRIPSGRPERTPTARFTPSGTPAPTATLTPTWIFTPSASRLPL